MNARKAAILVFFAWLPIQAETIEIIRAGEATYLEAEEAGGIVTLTGGIILRFSDKEIQSDTIHYRAETGEIFAEEGVVLRDASGEITGKSLIYNVKAGRGTLYRSRINREGFVIESVSIHIAEEGYALQKAEVTSCTEASPHYYFRADKMYLYESGDLFAVNVITYVGHTPVFYLPVAISKYEGTGIITQFGQSRLRGYFLQNTYRHNEKNPVLILPETMEITGDWYDYGGESIGLSATRREKNYHYNLLFSMARREATEIVNGHLTDRVLQDDGSRSRESDLWSRAKADAATSFAHGSLLSTITTDVDYATHRNYDQEFGERVLPQTTIEAVFSDSLLQGESLLNTIHYNVGYSLAHPNLTATVTAGRSFLWDTTGSESYIPLRDTVPAHSLRGAWKFPLQGPAEAILIEQNLDGLYSREYSYGDLVFEQIREKEELRAGLLLYPLSGLSLVPFAGPGFSWRQTGESAENSGFEQEDKRQNYLYGTTGFSAKWQGKYTDAHALYRAELSAVAQEKDPDFGDERKHTLHADFSLFPWHIVRLSGSTLREMRTNVLATEESRYRWARASALSRFDFRHGFPESKFGIAPLHSTHQEILAEVSHEYSPRYQTPVFTRYSGMLRFGGYTLPGISGVDTFWVGGKWMQNHVHQRATQAALSLGFTIALHPFWKLKMEGESLAEEAWRYYAEGSEHLEFVDDIVGGFTGGETVMNIHYLHAAIIHDLHDFLLELSYDLSRNPYYYGTGLRESQTFHEHRVFLSFYHKMLGENAVYRGQIYRADPVRDGTVDLP